MESSSSKRTTISSMSSTESLDTSRGDQGVQPKLKRIKTNEYLNLTEVQADMNIMLENAKAHNLPDSHLYKTAVKLQNLLQQNVLQLLMAENDSDPEDQPLIRKKTLLEHSGSQTSPPTESDSGKIHATGFIASPLIDNSSASFIPPVVSKSDFPMNKNQEVRKATKDMPIFTIPGPFKQGKIKNKDSKFFDETEPMDEEMIIDGRDDEVGIPTLVVEILLEETKDVDLLKTCRLINKYWNGLACSSLQRNSVVEIDEMSENDQEFDSRLNDILLSLVPRSSSTPSPFKNFHISTSGFAKDRFYNLVLSEQFPTTKLTISMVKKSNVQRLNEFLKAKQGELTSIQLNVNGVHHVNTLQAFNDIKLPCLKSLIIDGPDNNPNCNCTSFEVLIKALADSSLQYLSLKIISCCWIPILKLNLSRIVKLKLDRSSYHLPEEFWDVLANLQLPSLQTLILYNDERNETEIQKFNTFLNNVSSTLLKLEYNNVVNHTNLFFPKLQDLNMYCPPDMSDFFTVERFPSLQTLTLTKADINEDILTDVFHPLKNVRSLDVSIVTHQRTHFPFAMLNLTRIFPNVEKFGISLYERYPSVYLGCIHRTFPNLKALNIKKHIGFTILAGMCEDDFKEYLSLGMAFQDFPRRSSIFDFTELESLVLPLVFDKNIFCYLSLLTKLKYLEFEWGYYDIDYQGKTLIVPIPIQVIGDNLKHFNRIGIDYGVSQNVLEKLQKALPDCEVTRSIENRSSFGIHFICTR